MAIAEETCSFINEESLPSARVREGLSRDAKSDQASSRGSDGLNSPEVSDMKRKKLPELARPVYSNMERVTSPLSQDSEKAFTITAS